MKPGKSFYEKIDSVDWSAFLGPYGPATEAPSMLKDLAEDAPDVWGAAFDGILDLIDHQDAITPAAYPVTPFLVELARTPELPARAEIVRLLADASVGGSHVRFVLAGRPRFVEEEGLVLSPIRKDILAGSEDFLGLVRSEDPALRAGAALLVAMLPELAAESLPLLREAAMDDRDEPARATAVVALAYLAERAPDEGDVARIRAIADASTGLLRGAALAGLAIAAPLSATEDLDLELLDVIESQRAPFPGFLFFEGKLDELCAVSLADAALRRKNLDVLFLLLDATRGRLPQPHVARALLHAAFDGRREGAALDATQRKVVQEILARKLVYRTESALAKCGLPTNEAELEQITRG